MLGCFFKSLNVFGVFGAHYSIPEGEVEGVVAIAFFVVQVVVGHGGEYT